jgi:hypothetical protein
MPRQRPDLKLFPSLDTTVHHGRNGRVIIETLRSPVNQFQLLSPEGQDRLGTFLASNKNSRQSVDNWQRYLLLQEDRYRYQGIDPSQSILSLLALAFPIHIATFGQLLSRLELIHATKIDALANMAKSVLYTSWKYKPHQIQPTLKLADALRDAARDFAGLPFDSSASTYLSPEELSTTQKPPRPTLSHAERWF